MVGAKPIKKWRKGRRRIEKRKRRKETEILVSEIRSGNNRAKDDINEQWIGEVKEERGKRGREGIKRINKRKGKERGENERRKRKGKGERGKEEEKREGGRERKRRKGRRKGKGKGGREKGKEEGKRKGERRRRKGRRKGKGTGSGWREEG